MSDDLEERDLLAAEYVLGTLEPEAAREVARRAELEADLASAIAAWETRLAPLAQLAEPVLPPPALWERLSESAGLSLPGSLPATVPAPRALTAVPGGAPPRRPTPVTRRLGFWRATTAAGFALAAAVAAFAYLRPATPGPIAALVPANAAPAAFVVFVQPNGAMRMVPLEPLQVAVGRSLELWAVSPGSPRPVSLGVIPAGGRVIEPPPAAATGGTRLLVSLEPEGGSPTGSPTGPVVYGGTLARP